MPNSSQSWETGVPSRRCRLTAATFSETGRWRRGCSDMGRYLHWGYANPHEGFFQFQRGRNKRSNLTMSSILRKGVIRAGRVEVDEPINLPDGSEVTIIGHANGKFVGLQ